MVPRLKNKPVWFELPVRVDQLLGGAGGGVSAILAQLGRGEYPSGLVQGVVLSDRAAGLAKFAEVEQMLEAKLVRGMRREFPGLEVYNIVRTGDRCRAQLNAVLHGLAEQGSSGAILVSGHEFRSSLRAKAMAGQQCNRQCGGGCNGRTGSSILCGKESRLVLQEEKQCLLPLGAVMDDPVLDYKPQASFHVTQIAPFTTLTPHMSSTASWLDTFPVPVTMSVMPMMSSQDIVRAAKLSGRGGGGGGVIVDAELFTPQRGMELAKETLRAGLEHDKVKGFYLYSPSARAVTELAEFIAKQ